MSNILQFPNKNTKDISKNADKINTESKSNNKVIITNIYFLFTVIIFVYLLILVD